MQTHRKMKLEPETIYHIYNQGNNRQKIFFEREDYITFLKLYRTLVFPYCETLAYCLMPNHFHFMVYSTDKSVELKKLGAIHIQELSNAYRLLLSKYAQLINDKKEKSGSLFRQKTKAKEITFELSNQQFSYAELCWFYIHQNPVVANLCSKMEDWEFSSYQDFVGLRKGTLCNIELTQSLLGWAESLEHSSKTFVIDAEIEKKLMLS